MQLIADGLAVLATIALGLSAGALVAEGGVLVPFWRSLQADAFLAWYRQNAALLVKFFAPLESVAAALALVAAALSWLATASVLLIVAALLAIAVLAAFPAYFQKANASFAAGTIARERVAEELRRWSRWHWARTVLAVAAFVCAVLALRSGA